MLLAAACQPQPGLPLIPTYTPNQQTCPTTADIQGHPGMWIVSGNQGFCVSNMGTSPVVTVGAPGGAVAAPAAGNGG